MQKNKRTRKYRKLPKKCVYRKKTYKHRTLKYGRYRGGLKQTDVNEITKLKELITLYIQHIEQNQPQEGTLEYPKYKEIKKNLTNYKYDDISNKEIENLTKSDLKIIENLALQIIDENTGISRVSRWFIRPAQKLFNQIALYFINEIELNDNTEFIFKKRITNNMPYLDVIRKKDGYETTYDVNEMFALLKSELSKPEDYKKKMKESILKKLTIDTNFGLELVPPPPAKSSTTNPSA